MLALTLAVTALAACGSDGTTTSSTSKAPTTTTTLSPEEEAAQPLLDAGTLVLDDLPEGFTDTGTVADSDADTIFGGEDACEAFRLLTDHGVASRFSPVFRRESAGAFDRVDAYLTADDAAARMALTKEPGFVDCLHARADFPYRTGAAQLPEGTTYDGSDVSPLAVDIIGDDTTGYRITGHFVLEGDDARSTETVLTDIIFLRVGRALVELSVAGPDTATLAEVETTALGRIADRLAEQLGA